MNDVVAALPRVEQLVRERTGIAPSRIHAANREHVVRTAMAREGIRDPHAFCELIARDARVFEALVSDWTVPESYFFREPSHFAYLRSEVLPALTRSRRRPLACWSAGCAAGEEAYSLAILLEQAGIRDHARVLGSDISRAALARAKEAHYSRWALRVLTPSEIATYFRQVGTSYQLLPRLRERVRFVQHNLASELYPRPKSWPHGFDLILCRNVLIYFAPEAVQEAGQRLTRSLAPEGYLLLGPSDPALDVGDTCDVVSTPAGLLYRRRGDEASALRPLDAPIHVPPSRRAPLASSRPPAVAARAAVAREQEPAPSRSAVESVQLLRRLADELGPTAAETACRDELALHPLSAALHALRAELLIDLGRDDEADEAVRRALYLDRSLPLAQLLSATLAERRGDRAAAQRSYAQLAEACRGKPADDPIAEGGGLTFAELSVIAAARAEALTRGGAP